MPLDKRLLEDLTQDPKTRLVHGLMSQDTPSGDWKWIRHEDWKFANDQAKNFKP